MLNWNNGVNRLGLYPQIAVYSLQDIKYGISFQKIFFCNEDFKVLYEDLNWYLMWDVWFRSEMSEKVGGCVVLKRNVIILKSSHTLDQKCIYQGLFCHDQVSSCKFLKFFNLSRNLQMFLDTMEPRTENRNSSLEKTVLIIWAQICGIIS